MHDGAEGGEWYTCLYQTWTPFDDIPTTPRSLDPIPSPQPLPILTYNSPLSSPPIQSPQPLPADFDPFTWRHQVLYDDGEVQDIRLIQEQVRHAYDDEKTLDRVKWYDAGLMEGLPSLVSGDEGCR